MNKFPQKFVLAILIVIFGNAFPSSLLYACHVACMRGMSCLPTDVKCIENRADECADTCGLSSSQSNPGNQIANTPQEDGGNNKVLLEKMSNNANSGAANARAKKEKIENRTTLVEAIERQELEDLKNKQSNPSNSRNGVLSEADNKLLDIAIKRNRDGKAIPRKIAESASDPELKEGLNFVASTSELKEKYKKDRANLLATIAQLSQMALTTAQRAQNLGAVDPKNLPAVTAQKSDAQNPSASKIADAKTAVSTKNEDKELTAEDIDQNSSLTAEQKTKLKAAIEAAAKRKQLLALKQRLQNRLKPGSSKKDLEAEEATSAFNLDLIPDEPHRSIASTNPDREKEEFLNSAVFHAMQAQFSMDGSQTRAEVERMLDEVERELGDTGDILAGILGTNSKSLFERIREAHLQCLRQNCVLALWKNRVP